MNKHNDPAEGGRWFRLRSAVGPTLAGLVGGATLGLVALPNMAPLCRNMAATYAGYPSLERPWPAASFDVPGWLEVLAIGIGLAGPVAVGALAVWLARPRDIWGDFSAGLSAATAATLSAFAAGIGWPALLALVVVPSIPDLTLLGESPPAGKAQPLAQHYPDLRQVEPGKRGSQLTAKVVTDQSAGGLRGIWVGLLLSAVTAGSAALAGAMTAGYLRRRGDRLSSAIAPYLEVTIPLTATIALAAAVLLTPAWSVLIGDNPLDVGWPALAGLVAVSALMIAGVLGRWPWPVRLCLALTLLTGILQARHDGVPWFLPVAAMALAAFMLVRQFRGKLLARFSFE